MLACDQRISPWAGDLRNAGLEGGTDELRARAFLDLVLGEDFRPRAPGRRTHGPRWRYPGQVPPQIRVRPGVRRAGAARLTLTDPLGTAAERADRPGELSGHGPVDPWLARDLVGAAARNPKTTWCVTVTDEHGHAVGHGCARPEPKGHGKRAGPGPPGFSFTPASGRAARRVRHLAAARPGRRAGHDRRERHPGHSELRAPVPGPGP